MEKFWRGFNLAQSRFLSLLILLARIFVTLAHKIFILRQLRQIFSAPKFLHLRYLKSIRYLLQLRIQNTYLDVRGDANFAEKFGKGFYILLLKFYIPSDVCTYPVIFTLIVSGNLVLFVFWLL